MEERGIPLEGVAQALTDKIRAEYPRDVAVFALYGSYVRGAAHALSDLDFYIIPKTPRGREPARGFLIGEVGFDLWPLSWERAERIAAYEGTLVSIVADAQVRYAASEEDARRFAALQAQAREPGEAVDFAAKARGAAVSCAAKAARLRACPGQPGTARYLAMELLAGAAYCVALANRRYLHRGFAAGVREALDLPRQPEGFAALCGALTDAADTGRLIRAADGLLAALLRFLDCPPEPDTAPPPDQEAAPAAQEPPAAHLTGFYEEIKSLYNKIVHACGVGDALAALMAGAAIYRDLEALFGPAGQFGRGFSDPLGAYDPALPPDALARGFASHEACLVSYLTARQVEIRRFPDFTAWKTHLGV